MDEQAVVRAIERWRQDGDEQWLCEALRWLEHWLRVPAQVARVLGGPAVESVRQEVIEELIVGKSPLRADIRRPRAFALTVFRNKLRDRLRRHARLPDVGDPGVSAHLTAQTRSESPPDAELQLIREQQLQQLVRALEGLRLEERAALLLHHAPDRLAAGDWRAVAERHPPPPPSRPTHALERDDIAALLYPGAPAAQAYERTGKLLQRTYAKLRRAQAAHPDAAGEEAP